MKQKFISGLTALFVGLTLVPASGLISDVSVVKAHDREEKVEADGYDYQLWNQNDTGSADMQVGSNGTFSCSWSGIENCLFRTSKKFGSTNKYQDYGNIAINYDIDYQPMGNSYICVYGLTENPTVEYFIVEAWGEWRPPGQTDSLGTFSSDGKQYDIYKSMRYSQLSIHGAESIAQYWSVQKTDPVQTNQMNNLKGTITVSNHFKQWEEAGLKMGKLYEMSLDIEGYRSDGKADVNKNELIIENENPDPPADDNPSTKVQTTEYLKNAFGSFFKVGTNIQAGELDVASDFIKNNFNAVTPLNGLLPAELMDQLACQKNGDNVNTQVSFGSDADRIMQFCSDNNIALRGNAFISGYNYPPDWFFRENFTDNGAYVSKEIIDKRIESFIKNTFEAIAKQYPDLELYAYDVCDGLLYNGWEGLNNTQLARVYGDYSFIEKAFTYARKYAPSGCQLYLSENKEYVPETAIDIYNMAMKLKSKGIIDGIGMGSVIDYPYSSGSVYETAMNKFLSTGLDVQITCLYFDKKAKISQEPLFKDVFRLCVENAPHVTALTIWGQSGAYYRRDPDTPILFDFRDQETEEYLALMEYAKTLQNTDPPASTDLKGDVDCNGSVTSADIVKLMQSMIGKATLSAQENSNADINKDGNISIVDLILLKNSLL